MSHPAARAPNPQQISDLYSWGFWKKRLARASIVGAAVLMITQLLPAVPEEQRIEVHAPDGFELTEINLSYSETPGGQALAGTQLRSPSPSSTLIHKFDLANGDYYVHVKAQLSLRDSAAIQLIQESRLVSLSGSTQIIRLDPPRLGRDQ